MQIWQINLDYKGQLVKDAVYHPLLVLFIKPQKQAVHQSKELKGVMVNGMGHKTGLFAEDVIAFLEQLNKSLPLFMKILETYGYFSGYKINITKTKIWTLNYCAKQIIR